MVIMEGEKWISEDQQRDEESKKWARNPKPEEETELRGGEGRSEFLLYFLHRVQTN